VPVQWCTLPLPIALLPLRAARPVQSLSACTTVHFTFNYTSTLPTGRTACTEPQCLYNGALYLYLYLYSPYGPHGLYRASVPVQRCTLTLPIPLLPLWTARPVQSLGACTTVHFTFTHTSMPPMGRTDCTEPQCLYNGALYLYLYLYSPYEPHGLYRASVPVQRCTLPLPTLLLTLWAAWPVQSLSACTTVHFTSTYTSTPPMGRTACTQSQCLYNGALYLHLYLYSPYGPHGLYRASVPVQRCTLTLPIPLLPLWAARPVQSLGACTTVHFTVTYTSTPPMGRTACTEPQCLYNDALYLLPLFNYRKSVLHCYRTETGSENHGMLTEYKGKHSSCEKTSANSITRENNATVSSCRNGILRRFGSPRLGGRGGPF